MNRSTLVSKLIFQNVITFERTRPLRLHRLTRISFQMKNFGYSSAPLRKLKSPRCEPTLPSQFATSPWTLLGADPDPVLADIDRFRQIAMKVTPSIDSKHRWTTIHLTPARLSHCPKGAGAMATRSNCRRSGIQLP